MLERRTVLAGLAGLPAAGLPIMALVSNQPDPFATYHWSIVDLHDAIDHGSGSDDDKERLMDRWGEIDAQALAGKPVTLGGALGALQMARREFVQFQMMDREETEDPSKKLVLHLIDGAIAVLRQAAGGGVA